MGSEFYVLRVTVRPLAASSTVVSYDEGCTSMTRFPYVGHRGEPQFARAIFRNEKESHGSRA